VVMVVLLYDGSVMRRIKACADASRRRMVVLMAVTL
jgi:hypothetical protein